MKTIKVVSMADASWVIRVWLWMYTKANGFSKLNGWASFWHTVYIATDKLHDLKVIAHECQHIKQIDDLGILKFTYKYLKETVKNGYRNNKYEIEARAATIEQFRGIYTIHHSTKVGAYTYL